MLSLQGEEWGGGWSLVRVAILENQSHTVIMSSNGEASQPQQKDKNKNKMSEKQSEIQLY